MERVKGRVAVAAIPPTIYLVALIAGKFCGPYTFGLPEGHQEPPIHFFIGYLLIALGFLMLPWAVIRGMKKKGFQLGVDFPENAAGGSAIGLVLFSGLADFVFPESYWAGQYINLDTFQKSAIYQVVSSGINILASGVGAFVALSLLKRDLSLRCIFLSPILILPAYFFWGIVF